MSDKMDAYEQRTFDEIERWRHRPKSAIGRFVEPAEKLLHRAADFVLDNRAGQLVTKAVAGVLGIVNDGAAWSVLTSVIFREYRNDGCADVTDLAGIRRLPLEQVDKTVGYLAAKYKLAAAAEGAASGAVGIFGIPHDVVSVVALSLRAVNEYATYYGYDVTLEHERRISLSVISLAAVTEIAAKEELMATVAKVAAMAAKKKTWDQLEKVALVKGAQHLAEALGIRLTKAKLAAVAPFFGAAVSAAFNAYFLKQVTDNASMFYRDRFLRDKYDLWPEATDAV